MKVGLPLSLTVTVVCGFNRLHFMSASIAIKDGKTVNVHFKLQHTRVVAHLPV